MINLISKGFFFSVKFGGFWGVVCEVALRVIFVSWLFIFDLRVIEEFFFIREFILGFFYFVKYVLGLILFGN